MEEINKIKVGRADYEERKEEKLERYTTLAQKAKKESKSRHEAADKIASFIPFGQPILIGHHSEKRERKDQEKIFNNIGKAIELDKKSEYYLDKAKTVTENNAISSDNPEALTLLEKKLEKLTSSQELMKNVNAYYRKNKTCVGCKCVTDEQAKKLDASMKTAYSWETAPFPSYRLTNNNATIKATQKRIDELKKIGAIEEQEFCFEGGKIKLNKDDNRVQIYFNSIPNEDTRKTLKSYGFKWAPSVKAWQRLLNGQAIYYAKRACGIK